MTSYLRHSTVPTDQLKAAFDDVMENTELCSIATSNADGTVHINTAFISQGSGYELYFLTDPNSVHSKNIAREPSVAITVFDTHQRWDDKKSGLQLFGRAERAEGDIHDEAMRSYGQRFSGFRDWASTLAANDRLSLGFYRVIIQWVKIFDESRFGDDEFLLAEIVRGTRDG